MNIQRNIYLITSTVLIKLSNFVLWYRKEAGEPKRHSLIEEGHRRQFAEAICVT